MTISNPNWYRFRQLDDQTIELSAPAKVNLFLRVPGKRPDGYHYIESLMQTVDWFDSLTLSKSDVPGCSLMVISELTPLGTGSDNLVNRAYEALKGRFPDLSGVEVTLKKSIPIEAGLGGGSSDAATMLFGLNRLFNLELTDSELAAIGAEIGSDVPFFFTNGSALVSGRGEILKVVTVPLDYWLVIAKPTAGLSTAEGFRALDRQLTVPPKMTTLESLSSATNSESFSQWLALLDNDFEDWASDRLPALRSIKTALQISGAEVVRLSGSGSALFGLFRERPEKKWAEAGSCAGAFGAASENTLIGVQTMVCRPIRRSETST